MPVGLLQVHQVQVGPVDPVPDAPPLPGGAADVVRFFMEVPQWLQIGGGIVGVLGVLVLTLLGWRHRRGIVRWVGDLPAVVKAGAAAILIAGGAVVSVGGYQVYDFVEHDNRFCTGCHVMADAYLRFEESPHAALGCKECHAQPKTESARQLYLWVLERPHEVGPHSPVPDARCTSCHVEGDPREWPQIAASLGHRVHLESDDPELADVMCVSCHGVSVHEFTPAESTCGACHESAASIRLGRMAAETELHCVACHDFLSDRPTDLPGAPAGMALLPERPQCVACHDMTALLADEELDGDPHGAVCGACHDPHTQESPEAAVGTCAGCHEGSDTLTIFHTGTHAPIHAQCTACHSAHEWRVQGSECLDCHESILGPPPAEEAWSRATPPEAGPMRAGGIRAGSGTPQPAPPSSGLDHEWLRAIEAEGAEGNGGRFEALHAVVGHGPNDGARGDGDAERGPTARPGGPALDGLLHHAPDTLPRQPRPFLHRQHEALSCLECHGRADEHGVLTVGTPQQCAACHHDPQRGYECAACHDGGDIPAAREVGASMALTVWEEPRVRGLPFEHGIHEAFACQECHTEGVMLGVELECAACHDDHHRPEADCTSCHLPAEEGVHGLEVHLTCSSSGCHAGTAGERPPLARTLCLTCHREQRDHEPGLACQQCHMVPDPPPARGGADAAAGVLGSLLQPAALP
jgi:hypothetical protein